MGKNNIDINLGKLGMDRDKHPSVMEEHAYRSALNTNYEDTNGDGLIMLQNEPSNVLCTKFEDGYVVIGFKSDLNADRVYFLLTNPQTKVSEIGYIDNTRFVNDIEDVESKCRCGFVKHLSTPLEDIVQWSTCQYVTLLEDSCNKCLNFSIDYPVFEMELKDEKCGKTIYWTDYLNPQRQLNLDDILEYRIASRESCSTNDPEVTCLNCDKLRIFKLFDKPCLTPEVIQVGGNLKSGMYEALIAYCDKAGNELSDYYSITPPIPIFDQNNQIIDQVSQDYRTQYAIGFNVDGLDTAYEYYKIVFIQTTGVNREVVQFVEGIHSTSESRVSLTTDVNKDRISLREILNVRPFYETAKGMASSNGYLFQFGLKAERELNLQPVVNLMGSLFHWQTSIAHSKLYENGVFASKYTGYMRDENYAFSIRFSRRSGKFTANFPLISRPAEGDEKDVVDNTDTQSVLSFAINCSKSDRDKRFQFYNTASLIGTCPTFTADFNCFSVAKVIPCTVEGVATLTDETFTIADVEDYTDFESYIREFAADICDAGSTKYDAILCDYITDTYADICVPEDIKATAVVTITGTSGTANIVINGTGYLMTFNTDIDTTIADFISTHGDTIATTEFAIVSVISLGGDDQLQVEYPNGQVDVSVVNASGDLAGSAVITGTIDTGEECVEGCEATDDAPTVEIEASITNESTEYTEKTEDDYELSDPATICSQHELDSSGDPIALTTGTGLTTVYDRLDNSVLESCSPATSVTPIGGTPSSLRFDFYEDAVLANLQLPQTSEIDATIPYPPATQFPTSVSLSGTQQFTAQLHKGAIWLKFDFEEGEDVAILELTGISSCGEVDDLTNTIVRVSAYDSCTDLPHLTSTMVDLANGGLVRLDRSWFSSNSIRIAIDAPIETGAPNYYIDAPCGCFYAYKRDVEYSQVDVTVSGTFDKVMSYNALCYFKVPKVDKDCDPQPFQYGKFGYTESNETYPDNEELYNSSGLKISEDDLACLTDDDKTDFENYYTTGVVGGNYTLDSEATNFRCKNIRHFKMPDNETAPFMSTGEVDQFVEPVIFPLGVTVDNNVINAFLDIAVKNGLITQKERNSITGYEIFRGDRALDKSVIAKGYLYDMYSYQENERTIHFSNFPYNELGENGLLYADKERTSYIQHPFGGSANNRFTFHSPDTHFQKPALPSELKVDGYMFGNSRGVFNTVEDHPKWSILGSTGRALASGLAIAEGTFEAAITTGNMLSNLSGTTIGGSAFSIAAAIIVGITLVSHTAIRIGQYRYQWLQSLKDLGPFRNYANFYTSVGYYNKFTPFTTENAILRGIAASGYLKPDKALIKEEDSGVDVRINNFNRESSVFISTGESYNIPYPVAYMGYDDSRTLASTEGVCDSPNSEIIKNIASPYVTLRNYLPNQYGDIGSVRWLPTGHCGDLTDRTKNAAIVITGTSGTANINIDGTDYLLTFNTDISTTIDDFLTNHSDTILATHSATVTKTNTETITISYPCELPDITITNASGDLSGTVTSYSHVCQSIYGGDTYISWMSLKRKMPLFIRDAMGLADDTPFNYYFYRNVGYPKFYVDYLTTERNDYSVAGSVLTGVFTDVDSEVETDCEDKSGNFYLPEEAKFYLYYYGIPQFLVESTINLNMRHAKPERHEHFYPQSGDYMDWTQEKNVSIRRDNTYNYNFIFSKDVSKVAVRTLPVTYSSEIFDCLYDEDNGVIYSEQDNSEQELTDPWLVYRAANHYQFPTSMGKLIALTDIESLQILGRFENGFSIFNSVDKIRDRITPETQETDIGGIFATRPLSFFRTALGYAGTQHRAMVSCEYGHFFVDAMRGQVFQLSQSGQQVNEISSLVGQGRPSGMRNWFKSNLPFKIIQGVTDMTPEDVDNAFKGLGITMGWDSRFRRVFITKKDYIVKEAYKGKLTYRDRNIWLNGLKVSLTDTNIFEDCSWTIAYSPITQSWISFYSFKPNFYIAHNNYFQTGVNYSSDSSELGLWSHLLTNRSYQVFYGKKYPWMIELIINNKYANRVLKSLEYYMDSRRYQDEYNFSENRRIGFNKAYVYNNSQNSGLLNLVTEQPNNMYQQDKYPITNTDSRDILATQNELRWTFNSFFNQVRDELSNVPIWNIDNIDIERTINLPALNYRNSDDLLVGDWFFVRFIQDETSQYKMIFKNMTNLSNLRK